ncbi:T9SS type A sorting domain-containing protein, partial [bacterium]|nr:T9SS type A sorting domain-containing protein [bacterium]
ASWDFSEGVGTTIFDNSGVSPAMDLTIDNPANVTWVQDGLRFDNPARAMSATPDTKLFAQCRASNEVSVEAWVEPLSVAQDGPASLVALSSRPGDRAFMVGQRNNTTHGRWTAYARTGNTNGEGSPEFDPNTWLGFPAPGLMHIVYTRNTAGDESIYVDGVLVESGTATKTGDFGAAWAWKNTAYFVVGGEREDLVAAPWETPTFWQGTVYLMSVYDRAITSGEVGQNYQSGCGLSNPAQRSAAPSTEPDGLGDNVNGGLESRTNESTTDPNSQISRGIDLEFFPNPFNNEFHINVKSKEVDWIDVRITNVLGQTLFNGLDFKTGQLISVGTDLPAGVYFVQVTSGTRVMAFRILKK